MIKPEQNAIYVIELCGGEQRRWWLLSQKCDGENVWWRDEESTAEFDEASLM